MPVSQQSTLKGPVTGLLKYLFWGKKSAR